MASRYSSTIRPSPNWSPPSAIIQNTSSCPPTGSTILLSPGSTTTSAPSIPISPNLCHPKRSLNLLGAHPSCHNGGTAPSSTATNGSMRPTRTTDGSRSALATPSTEHRSQRRHTTSRGPAGTTGPSPPRNTTRSWKTWRRTSWRGTTSASGITSTSG